MTKIAHMRFILVLIVLAAAGLACSMPGSASNLPPTAQPMTTEQFQNLENQMEATLANASGDVTITLTQDQINGIITSEMMKQSDKTITDPSVVLTGGHMEFYGKVNQSNISANLKVVLQPQVDADGKAHLNIVSINLGGLPVPDVLKNRVQTMADDSLNNYLNAGSSAFKVKSITVNEGQMTVTGARQ